MKRTCLYRHFSKDDVLLYIGITNSIDQRLGTHSQASKWMDQSVAVTLEWFDSREKALEAEREAIIKENPAHNIQGLDRFAKTYILQVRMTLAQKEELSSLAETLDLTKAAWIRRAITLAELPEQGANHVES